ncbi:MAG: hypothetical protein OEX12_00325 [Gammaproteobacteria bacterium]|nr:hypothetical protein [Gammaproteobacteria bacterium]
MQCSNCRPLPRSGRKLKKIREILRTKIDEWLRTITDERVRDLAFRHAIVSGGSIASMLSGEKVNDYDIYFQTKETALAVAEYYVNIFNKNTGYEDGDSDTYMPTVVEDSIQNIKGEVEERVTIYMRSEGVAAESETVARGLSFDDDDDAEEDLKAVEGLVNEEDYRPVFLSRNAITLTNRVQIIIRFFGAPEEIHKNFDFAHTLCWWRARDGKLHIEQEALQCMMSRVLLYRGSLYPLASIFRVRKFLRRGWRITAGQLLKIMWQISEVDLSDRTILEEQLIGVDAAYMHQLIHALRANESDTIDSNYAATLIDRIFE